MNYNILIYKNNYMEKINYLDDLDSLDDYNPLDISFVPDEEEKDYASFLHNINDTSKYNDENNNLFILFTSFDLLEKTSLIANIDISDEISEHTKKKRTRSNDTIDILPDKKKRVIQSTQSDDYIYALTPIIQKYAGLNTDINAKLKKDDILIKRIQTYVENKDGPYIHIENFGKHIETWMADFFICPVCKSNTLRRYAKNNFPAIDLVCINENHLFNDGVKFFQVKSMISGATFNNKPYFSLNDRTIHVGSYKYGKIVHNINITNPNYYLDKKILIGYICVVIDKILQNDLKISTIKSFCVLPKINHRPIEKKLFSNDNTEKIYDVFNLDLLEPLDQPDLIDQSDQSDLDNLIKINENNGTFGFDNFDTDLIETDIDFNKLVKDEFISQNFLNKLTKPIKPIQPTSQIDQDLNTDYFYRYIDENTSDPHIIKFSNELNDIRTLNTYYLNDFITIPINYINNPTNTWQKIPNPLNILELKID